MKFTSAAVAMVVAASICLAGCGLESSVNPDTAPPQSPHIYAAYSKDTDKVVIKWTPGAEADLAGYNVYRMGPRTRVNAEPITRPHFVDTNSESPDQFYTVTAVDGAGNESAPSAMVKVRRGPQSIVNGNGESGKN